MITLRSSRLFVSNLTPARSTTGQQSRPRLAVHAREGAAVIGPAGGRVAGAEPARGRGFALREAHEAAIRLGVGGQAVGRAGGGGRRRRRDDGAGTEHEGADRRRAEIRERRASEFGSGGGFPDLFHL